MKVEGQEAPAAPEKPAPDKDRFRQVLQETGAQQRPASALPARPGSAPGAVKPGPPHLPGQAKPGAAPPRPPLPAIARPAGPVLATARSALATPESLGQARQVMHAEAQRLGLVRGEAQQQGQERLQHRVSELLSRELAREERGGPSPSPAMRAPPPESPRAGSASEPATSGASEPRVGATGPGGTGAASSPDAVAPASRAEAAMELIEKIEVFVKSQRPALSLSLRGPLEATVEVERTGPREVALRIQGRRGPLPTEDLSRLRDALEARGLRLRSLRAE